MKRYLVIANETVGGDDLVKEVRRRGEEGVTAFHVVVPGQEQASSAGGDTQVAGGGPASTGAFADPETGPMAGSGTTTSGQARPGGSTDAADSGPDRARVLLEQVLDRLHAVAEEVTGEVGAPDPVEAARAATSSTNYDGVILATPPAGPSKLAGRDVPSRMESAVDVPLTTVYGARSDPRAAE